jgi:Holliday junction DNA helicase RuvA
MIAHLYGVLTSRTPDAAVLDVHGVGYLVSMTSRDLARLPPLGDDTPLMLHIVTHFREGAISLFGFLDPAQRDAFARLIEISGVGPKLALAILGTLSVQQLWDAAMSGNYATLSHVRGVGPQKARKLMVELKDALRDLKPAATAPQDAATSPQVSASAPTDAAAPAADPPKKRGRKPAAAPLPPPGAGILWQELRSALNNMGYPDLALEGVISDLQRDHPAAAAPGDLDQLVREALKRLRGTKRA